MTCRFQNRSQAGHLLAAMLQDFAGHPATIVLALPRGGVPVAFEVARELRSPLDIFLVRKLGVPFHEELAMGAIAGGGIHFLNQEVIDSLRIQPETINRVIDRERAELTRRERQYRRGGQPLEINGRVVILVDDGLATGASMRAAILALRKLNPARIICAVPVGARDTMEAIKQQADDAVCVHAPEGFSSVGEWYEDFTQTGDEEVRDLLSRATLFSRNIAPVPGSNN
jgi:putative phosphoribosyl transferase